LKGRTKCKFNGMNLYSIDGEIAVDKVCPYENFAEELEEVAKAIGPSGQAGSGPGEVEIQN
jgi:hypothetical protein